MPAPAVAADDAGKGARLWYQEHVERHLSTLRRHFSPICTDPEELHVPPSHVSWSSQEQSRFFQSISRHSRWRPDLIAAEVNKTEADVSWFIAFLDANNPYERQKGERKRAYHFGSAPAAMEVSESWAAREEELAGSIEDAALPPLPAEKVRVRHDTSTPCEQRRRRAERLQAKLELAKQDKRIKWLEQLTAEKLRELDALARGEQDRHDRIAEAESILEALKGRQRSVEEQALYRKLSHAATQRTSRRKAKLEAKGVETDDVNAHCKRRGEERMVRAPEATTKDAGFDITDDMTRMQIDRLVKRVDDKIAELESLEGPLTSQMALTLGIDVKNSLFHYGNLSHFSPDRSIDHRMLDTLSALVRYFVARIIYDLIPLQDVSAEHVEAVLANRELAGGLQWDTVPAHENDAIPEPAAASPGSSRDYLDVFPFEQGYQEDEDSDVSDTSSADEEHCELEEAQEAYDQRNSKAHETALWREESVGSEEPSEEFEAVRKAWASARLRRLNSSRKRKLKMMLGVYKQSRRMLSKPYLGSDEDENMRGHESESSESNPGGELGDDSDDENARSTHARESSVDRAAGEMELNSQGDSSGIDYA